MNEAGLTLAEEARYLHRCLFSEPLDDVVIQRYQRAHTRFMSGEGSGMMNKIVRRKLDAEAVELVLRRRGMGRELTRKFQILCYLLEVRAAYQQDFIATRTEPVRAFLALVSGSIRTAWLLGKGEFLIRVHGLL